MDKKIFPIYLNRVPELRLPKHLREYRESYFKEEDRHGNNYRTAEESHRDLAKMKTLFETYKHKLMNEPFEARPYKEP